MENLLDGLSKEDLIAVIAKIADTINAASDWRSHGMTDRETETISAVGSACITHCEHYGWFLPELNNKKELRK